MSENKINGILGTGLTFVQVLFIVFLVLKLTGTTAVATWSWWWVTSPLWIGVALTASIWIVIMLGLFLAAIINFFNKT